MKSNEPARRQFRDVKRYFEARGYEIVSRGGDKIIKAPADKIPLEDAKLS